MIHCSEGPINNPGSLSKQAKLNQTQSARNLFRFIERRFITLLLLLFPYSIFFFHFTIHYFDNSNN
ncbi:hypothetical protein MtrunA17_Chr1g0182661 [Medicago truncatula]|uniref:Transmembrane protein n=1 Tax=Medicago truncatula TaxID=3880 RepID=A0A396JRQ3_MEDTR|nr:hypothetical protein MtrunA17_Chr1g0182661 [Medicago truncatula]